MGRNWAEGLFDGGMLPSMDPPEDIQRCLNCTLPPSYCHGLPRAENAENQKGRRK